MKKNILFLQSRDGNTLSDRAALYALNKYIKKFEYYDFLEKEVMRGNSVAKE